MPKYLGTLTKKKLTLFAKSLKKKFPKDVELLYVELNKSKTFPSLKIETKKETNSSGSCLPFSE